MLQKEVQFIHFAHTTLSFKRLSPFLLTISIETPPSALVFPPPPFAAYTRLNDFQVIVHYTNLQVIH